MGARNKHKSVDGFVKNNQKKQEAVDQQPVSTKAEDKTVSNLWRLSSFTACLLIIIVGAAVFSSGLKSPFEGNDSVQIVNNPVVHSLSHAALLYEGGTSYNGAGVKPLSGPFYRPLMSSVYSVVYSFFGAHPLYYHVTQIVIYILSALLLFLVLSYPFKRSLALILSLLFLVHPINSQAVYALTNLDDALFFLFGIAAVYILFRFKSVASLSVVTVCLFLALLSKEAAFVFVAICLINLYWWDKKRLLPFIKIAILPIVIYIALSIHAVGLSANPGSAPIDKLSLLERLMNIPAILLFYMSKFIFPWKLASGYYWTQSKFSVSHFLIPLVVGLLVIAATTYMALHLKKKFGDQHFRIFVFFALWAAIGLVPYLQIRPLDMTVSESWFIFSLVGVLGMIGACLTSYNVKSRYILLVGGIIICLLGARTNLRGHDWENLNTLAFKDVAASPSDYPELTNVSNYYSQKEDYPKAINYLQRSIKVEPTYFSYYNLGVNQTYSDEYTPALQSYNQALALSPQDYIYRNADQLALIRGTNAADINQLEAGINRYPNDTNLWVYLSLFLKEHGDNNDAKTNMKIAAQHGKVTKSVYNAVLDNSSVTVRFINGKSIVIN